MVKCPICSEQVELSQINNHLDKCEFNHKKNKKSKSPESDSPIELTPNPSPPIEKPKTKNEIKHESEPKSLTSILSGQKKHKEKPRSYQYTPNGDSQSNVSSEKITIQPNSSPVIKRTIDEDHTMVESKRHKSSAIENLKITSNLPLSERLRPTSIAQYIGQSHLVGERGILRGYLKLGKVPSLILWGKPGTGKTTLARILAKTTNLRFVEMSGVMNGVSDCKKIFEEAANEMKLTKRPTIIFIDEIHRFSKNQQDIFLNYVERGIIILIGATTENPSFTINKAILSRCKVFTLEKLNKSEIRDLIGRGLVEINKVRKLIYNTNVLKLSPDAIDWIAGISDGDGRQALGFVEMVDSSIMNDNNDNSGVIEVDVKDVNELIKKSPTLYDRVGDVHYDTISAFHKSIRGSNPDAAMYYLARMLNGGEDPLYIARRMIRIASEDVGVLDDSCLPFAVAAYNAVQYVGLPEADLALVHCAVKLARAPKSIEIYKGWNEMKAWMNASQVEGAEIPLHLRNAPTKLMSDLGYKKGYKYNPDYRNGQVQQTYFPDSVGETIFLRGQHLGTKVDPDL